MALICGRRPDVLSDSWSSETASLRPDYVVVSAVITCRSCFLSNLCVSGKKSGGDFSMIR